MLDNYFNTTDYTNLPLTTEQNKLIKKDIKFVKGCDFYKGYYDTDITIKNIYVRYYQISIFDEFGKCAIRSFLFEGSTSKGACFYDYKMIEIKEYKLSKKKIDKFVKYLTKQQKKTPKDFKIMFKFYPVYNFLYENPPTGNDLNQCYSELLN